MTDSPQPDSPQPDDPLPDAVTLREEVAAWLKEHWDPSLSRHEWMTAVVDAGWAVPRWPQEWYGRRLPNALAQVVEEEFRAAGAPGTGQDRVNLWAGTALAYGSQDLKRRLIRPLLLGEPTMCLLYSEPGAGSDLAAVQTRAERDGDTYVVTGQKVWTSSAADADYGMLLARTDWDVPKHAGLSFFFLPMRQPGVEVRPLRQITGESHFNEVFLTDAVVPAANLLGEVNGGWRVLQTALAYERVVMGEVNAGVATRSAATRGVGRAAGTDLVALAKEHGRDQDPLVRQAIARLYSLRAVNRWNGQRARVERRGGGSSPVASLGKLAMSRLVHEGGRLEAAVLGPEALLDGPDNPAADSANFTVLNAYFTSIGGGTDQIQRNIIGERILGLPREPELDRDVPFRQVRKAGVPDR